MTIREFAYLKGLSLDFTYNPKEDKWCVNFEGEISQPYGYKKRLADAILHYVENTKGKQIRVVEKDKDYIFDVPPSLVVGSDLW